MVSLVMVLYHVHLQGMYWSYILFKCGICMVYINRIKIQCHARTCMKELHAIVFPTCWIASLNSTCTICNLYIMLLHYSVYEVYFIQNRIDCRMVGYSTVTICTQFLFFFLFFIIGILSCIEYEIILIIILRNTVHSVHSVHSLSVHVKHKRVLSHSSSHGINI